MKFINFSKNEQSRFMRLVKEKTNLTWKQIAHLLAVDRSMVYFYLNEKSKLPYLSYKKLCKLASLSINFKIPKIEIKNRRKNIQIDLKLSKKLAEFIGILAGDGHLSKITTEISISSDKDFDKDYSFFYLPYLIKSLFKVNIGHYVQHNVNKAKCYIYSKNIMNYLVNEFKLPMGNKKNRLHIPNQIIKNKEYAKSYVRGFFDTDGSFHRHHKNTAAVEFISRDKGFLKELNKLIKSLRFSTCITGKSIYIYTKDHIDRFFKEIEPKNKKHLLKYKFYKEKGYVPKNNEFFKIKR